jgi:hypothetical protein
LSDVRGILRRRETEVESILMKISESLRVLTRELSRVGFVVGVGVVAEFVGC